MQSNNFLFRLVLLNDVADARIPALDCPVTPPTKRSTVIPSSFKSGCSSKKRFSATVISRSLTKIRALGCWSSTSKLQTHNDRYLNADNKTETFTVIQNVNTLSRPTVYYKRKQVRIPCAILKNNFDHSFQLWILLSGSQCCQFVFLTCKQHIRCSLIT